MSLRFEASLVYVSSSGLVDGNWVVNLDQRLGCGTVKVTAAPVQSHMEGI